MSQYKCLLCNTKFDNQKSHHTKHLSSNKHIVKKELEREKLLNAGIDVKTVEKRLAELETYVGSTRICYVDKTKISIEQYEENLDKFQSKIITDIQDRELVYCHGPKVKSYFRVKEDNPMTDWHREWQSHFPDHVEKTFSKNGKKRRTDVDLDDNLVAEFQNSLISKENVDKRMNDYRIDHDKEIIWIINGDGEIKVSENQKIINGENIKDIILNFSQCTWKYRSFLAYATVYLDIDAYIYKISPKDVRSHMISVTSPVRKKYFTSFMKKNLIQEAFNGEVPKQANVFVTQMGAGNGKTYSIIQLINNEDFYCYDTFIYLAKQHTAKDLIFGELERQKDTSLENIIFDEESYNDAVISKRKQHVVKFSAFDQDKTIIIGTIDSFIYNISRRKSKGIDQFLSWTTEVFENKETSCRDTGSFKYANDTRYMNKKTLIIVDEIQDLHPNYAKCLLYLVSDKYVNFYAVGDKLQSINFGENAFTILTKIDSVKDEIKTDIIRVIINTPVNKCRRFTNPQLINFVNQTVNFEKFNVPKIQADNSVINNALDSVVAFHGDTIFSRGCISKNKVAKQVETIMEYYKDEVETNERVPEDFLIITPVMQKNDIIESLNLAIRQYWQSKNESGSYKKFSYVHKSEEGSSIDLEDSKHSTRIVTIHSSKGDGRPVVFIIGLSEKTLKIFSEKYKKDDTDGELIYESLFHVALTRMKEKIYIRLEPERDDIYERILKNCEIRQVQAPELKISNYIQFNTLIKEPNFNYFDKNILEPSQHNNLFEKISLDEDDKKIIDMKHHNIRYGIMLVMSMLKIDEYESNTGKSAKTGHRRQIFVILKILSECEIVSCQNHAEYYKILNEDNKGGPFRFPIYAYENNKGEYQQYYKYIIEKLDEVKKILCKFLRYHRLENMTCEQSIFLYFMKEIYQERGFSVFPIAELYDIVDIFTNNEEEKNKYIQHHHELVPIITDCWNYITINHPNIKYLCNQAVYLDSSFCNDLQFGQGIKFVGYDNDEVYIFVLSPYVNSINNNKILVDNIYETFAIKNVKKYCDSTKKLLTTSYEHFNNKPVVSYLITLDSKKPYKFSWTDGKKVDFIEFEKQNIIKIICEDAKNHYHGFISLIWTFYSFHKNAKSIDQIISLYNEEKKIRKNLPNFIIELFYEIKYTKKYTQEKAFKSRLIEIMDKTVETFFYGDADKSII